MSKNESRRERKDQENQGDNQSSGINKAYYWIIGVLFLVLILLIVFIFSRSGDNVNLSDEGDQSALIEEETGVESLEESEQEAEEENTDSDIEEPVEESTPPEEETEAPEDPEETNGEEDTEPEEENEEDSEIVNEDAPHDPGYAVDYSNGSDDRVEIKNRVMEATGLGDDLIEDWVGNDGPGRVVATVTSRDQSESYEVYLQYGDGSWHVTRVE